MPLEHGGASKLLPIEPGNCRFRIVGEVRGESGVFGERGGILADPIPLSASIGYSHLIMKQLGHTICAC